MDWNKDGRKDLITGDYDGKIRVYLNIGTDASPVLTNYQYLKVNGVEWSCSGFSKPEVVDWNNDGLLDIVCGEVDGYVYLLTNAGPASAPTFPTALYLTNNGTRLFGDGGYSSPAVADWNGDGKKDLLLGCYNGYVLYFENKGTDNKPVFNGSTQLTAGGSVISIGNGYRSRPEIGDWDGDGCLDLFLGTYEGNVMYYHAINGPFVQTVTLQDADGNSLWEPGDNLRLSVVLTNVSSLTTNVMVTVTSSNSWCVVINSNWNVGNLNPGAVTNNTLAPFELKLANTAPYGGRLHLRLAVTGNGGASQQTTTVLTNLAQPLFRVTDVLAHDPAGNCNSVAEPGETVQLLIKIKNSGYRAMDVTGRLSALTPGLRIINAQSSFGNLESNQSASDWTLPFCYYVSNSLSSNILHDFTLNLTYLQGAASTNLPVSVNNVRTTYTVSSNTPQVWEDIWDGTQLQVGDESYSLVTLPFNISLYGYTTNRIYVVANGILMLQPPAGVTYSVTPIPATNYPNNMIAPRWEDLDQTSAGSVFYKSLGTAPNRRWIVEWNSVPHYYNESSSRTFQAVLYENGTIKFQYGSEYSDIIHSYSVGLENFNGTMGTNWSLGVYEGLALTFTPLLLETDADKDGLPDAFERYYFGSLTNCCGTNDWDGDGLSNAHELRCGTDPVQPGSRLRSESIHPSGTGEMTIKWPAVAGMPYTVWQSTDATLKNWMAVTSTVAGANGFSAITNSIGPTQNLRLYRLSTP